VGKNWVIAKLCLLFFCHFRFSLQSRRYASYVKESQIHDQNLIIFCMLFYDDFVFQEVSFLLPSLLGLLLDCATCPDQTLASIAMGALIRLTEIAGHQFDEKDWTTLLDSLR
jgi:guanine nucleotide-exchange factor